MDVDREQQKVVKEDLEYLKNEWNQNISDKSLRITSAVLRRLLIEDNLNQVAYYNNIKVKVLVPEFYKNLDIDKIKESEFWQAGGGKSHGIQVQRVTKLDKAPTEEEIKAMYEKQKKNMGKSYPEKLSNYLEFPSYVIDGTVINKKEVIKYVCNKKGGVHYDSDRKDNKLEGKYELLDDISEKFEVANRNSVYYELISIGQNLNQSKDVNKLRKKLKHM